MFMLEIIADFNYLVAQAQSVGSVHGKYLTYCFQYLHYFFMVLMAFSLRLSHGNSIGFVKDCSKSKTNLSKSAKQLQQT